MAKKRNPGGCKCCATNCVIAYFCCCPVAGATVTWTRNSTGVVEHTATTDSNGKACYNVLHPAENYTVAASKTGYNSSVASTTISGTTVFPIALLLPPSTLTLTPPGGVGTFTATLIPPITGGSPAYRVCFCVSQTVTTARNAITGVCTTGSGSFCVGVSFSCGVHTGDSVISGGALCTNADFHMQLQWQISSCSGTETRFNSSCPLSTSATPAAVGAGSIGVGNSTNSLTQACGPAFSVTFNVTSEDGKGGAAGTAPTGNWTFTL